ncbi:uncharacterized protein PG986_012681 [Apiospora aurea]|uniref:TauD/TfdA-like domain-containing protein n=1 Tax=Apiospora aurea TaxID=335848 RepID=A0ABR1Q0Q4_9PEZI
MSTTTLTTIPATVEHHVLQHTPSLVSERSHEKPAVPGNDTASRILAIIERYRLLRPGQSDISSESNARLSEKIAASVSAGQPIRMCLPAFPFKSPNTLTKVLGRLPDKAEEFALAHLHGMCAAIQDIYSPGAKLTVISDGLVYNDLLGVSDRDVWAYGTALRQMSAEKGFSRHIGFARLKDVVQIQADLPDELDEIVYVCNASNFRHAFLAAFGDERLDVSCRIKEDDDTCMTYRGYIRFLSTDLQNVYPTGPGRSKSQYKKGVQYIAKMMLKRGDAFARAVKENFSDQLRLSIHPSTFENKISINLLPTDTSFTTPWHCTIAFWLDGTATTGHRELFEHDDAWELVHENGRPSFFRERSDLYSLVRGKEEDDDHQCSVSVSPIYPAGLLVRPADDGSSRRLSIVDIDAQRLRNLSERNSPVVFRGFAGTTDRDRFVAKAHELGVPTPWKFGLVLEVKDEDASTQGLNNVLSAEWMPWHYDGLFKTETRTNPADGSETVVSIPPKHRLHPLRFLRPNHQSLRPLKWTVRTGGFGGLQLTNLPLFADHPTTGRPCLRFHEPWPQSRTRFQPTSITIQDREPEASERICAGLAELLHDRRVAYYHAWEKGDLLVSDNILALHTRSDFTAGCSRELWRIHFD